MRRRKERSRKDTKTDLNDTRNVGNAKKFGYKRRRRKKENIIPE